MIAIVRLQIDETGGQIGCRLLAHYQLVVAATLVLIIIGSLVGAVVRPEEQPHR
jgi:hypothetical protein